MPASGYPTPDDFVGEADFICIPLIVPNKAEFKAAIYGLYGQMANDWFWKDFGTMSPQTAAWLSSLGLGQTEAYGECGAEMACEDVADCFETESQTNDALRQAIFEVTNQLGFGDRNSVNPDGTKIKDRQVANKLEETEILPMFECDLDRLWAGIRHGIVQRLDDEVRTTLENLVAISDIQERVEEFVEIVPVIGSLIEAVLTQISQLAPDMLNLYSAYSSIENLDEIACGIFSIVCAECRYPTFTEVYDYYASLGLSEMQDYAELVLQIAVDAVTLSVASAAQVFYHTFVSWQMWVLFIEAKFGSLSGTGAIIRMATLGEDSADDDWKILCDSCNEDYAIREWDYTQGQFSSYKTGGFSSGSQGTYISGLGWRFDHLTAGGYLLTMAQPLSKDWKIRAIGFNITIDAPTGYVRAVQLRPSPGFPNGSTQPNLDEGSDEYNNCKDGFLSITNFQEIAIRLSCGEVGEIYLTKIGIIFDADFAPPDARPTSDITLCS